MNIELTNNPEIILVDGKPRKCCLRSKSFPYLCLKIDGKLKSVHRLIAEQNIPNPHNKKFVNHKNGNKLDNRIENLEWVTCSENNFHSARILKKNKARIKNRLLTKIDADRIRQTYYSKKISQYQLAHMFGVSRSTIQKIIENKTYFV